MQPSPYVVLAQPGTRASRHRCLYSWVPAFAGMTEGSELTPPGITPTDPPVLGRRIREDDRRVTTYAAWVSHQQIRKCRHAGNQQVRLVRRRAEWTLAAVDEGRAHPGRFCADAVERVVGDEQHFVH